MWATMTRVQASGKSLPLKQDGTMNEITSEIMSEITIDINSILANCRMRSPTAPKKNHAPANFGEYRLRRTRRRRADHGDHRRLAKKLGLALARIPDIRTAKTSDGRRWR